MSETFGFILAYEDEKEMNEAFPFYLHDTRRLYVSKIE